MDELCHCGRVIYGDRYMCRECDLVRCDAYPMECPYRVIDAIYDRNGNG